MWIQPSDAFPCVLIIAGPLVSHIKYRGRCVPAFFAVQLRLLRKCIHVKAYMSVHNACPFGSCSAVYNWERVGSMLATLARRVLKIAVLRYVDDFFGPER
jgi:hypothetical protein